MRWLQALLESYGQGQIAKAGAQLKALRRQLTEQAEAEGVYQAEVDRLKAGRLDLEATIAELRGELTAASEATSRLEAELRVANKENESVWKLVVLHEARIARETAVANRGVADAEAGAMRRRAELLGDGE